MLGLWVIIGYVYDVINVCFMFCVLVMADGWLVGLQCYMTSGYFCFGV